MPKCERCGVTRATAETRRMRGSLTGARVCKDGTACQRRVKAQRAEERALNLSQLNRRRIERAAEQLTAVKESVPVAVWASEGLAHVREAWNQLQPVKGERA